MLTLRDRLEIETRQGGGWCNSCLHLHCESRRPPCSDCVNGIQDGQQVHWTSCREAVARLELTCRRGMNGR